ncbi:DUF2461 domain-containing protein [Skermania piniformis]|uniref:DUF2461 domain-containing protein n=1 Tax=Skermania pinensis TaxID=39122 RepID=A0ABX8S942_9ACTN|nr:DUF2461 domain-containing protein [Skermania piniformis]QXQ13085.1 DUF2461 domain-containing protein [Skermania piniformis]
MRTFAGFPIAALDFYEDLAADNSKAFWTAHKHIYETSIRAPMEALVDDLAAEFGPAKLFRPYRDVRFSKDKSPYKTAQGAVVRTGAGVGFYVQIDAAGLFTGGGFYDGTPAQLARLRAAIDDDLRGPELAGMLSATGFTVGGATLKTRPKGFPADHPRIELLRHTSLTLSREHGCPDWLTTDRAADEVRADWRQLRPVIERITAVVGPGRD